MENRSRWARRAVAGLLGGTDDRARRVGGRRTTIPQNGLVHRHATVAAPAERPRAAVVLAGHDALARENWNAQGVGRPATWVDATNKTAARPVSYAPPLDVVPHT